METLKRNLPTESITFKQIESTFQFIKDSEEFSDVILVCEDGRQVTANKLLLASSSPLFKDILLDTVQPIIYLIGLTFEDLTALMDFVFWGEAELNQTNLNSFLSASRSLKLKGIEEVQIQYVKVPSDTVQSCEGENLVTKIPPKPEVNSGVEKFQDQKKYESESHSQTLYISEDIDTKDFAQEKSWAIIGRDKCNVETEELSLQVNSMIRVSNQFLASTGEKEHICLACGFEGGKNNVRCHVESNHIHGVIYTCGICGTTSRYKAGLMRHKGRRHSKSTLFME